MLRLKSPIVIAAELPRYAGVEQMLARLLGFVFDEQCTLTYQSPAQIFKEELPWLVVRNLSGSEFALCITNDSKISSRAEYFSQLVRLSQFFSEARPRTFSLIPEWSRFPELQHTFELRTDMGIGAQVCLAYSHEEVIDALLSGESNSIESRHRLTSRCRIEAALPAGERHRSFSQRADVRLLLPGGAAIFYEARMSRTEGTAQLLLEKEGSTMEEAKREECNVTLSLGALELSIDDLLMLRPGMCIEFDAPEVFDGMLVVNGAPWLEAQVVLEERTLKVKIVGDAVCARAENNTAVEETSEEKLRLVG